MRIQPPLRALLEKQLQEYESIASDAHFIASQRGWDLTDTDPVLLLLESFRIRLKLALRNCESQIADMLIRRNTRGMIRGLRDLHRFLQRDGAISLLTQRLLDCETAGIRQLQTFL